jgi:hypothetical protein
MFILIRIGLGTHFSKINSTLSVALGGFYTFIIIDEVLWGYLWLPLGSNYYITEMISEGINSSFSHR